MSEPARAGVECSEIRDSLRATQVTAGLPISLDRSMQLAFNVADSAVNPRANKAILIMNAMPWTLAEKTPARKFHSEESHVLRDRILLEQVRACYCHTPGVIFGGPLAVPLFVVLLWNDFAANILIVWGLVTLSFHMLGGAVLHYGFRNDANPERNVWKWNRALYLLAAGLGASWGSIGILFFTPDLMTIQLVIYLWIFGAAALGALGMVAIHQGYMAFTVPLLFPIFITSCMQMYILHLGLAVVTVIYFAFLSYFSKNNNATMVDYLRTRFENIDLAEELARKNKVIEQAGREKSQFFAAASHDLRQPLHAQVLFVAELKARTLDADSREIIAYLEDSIDSMRSMYDQMLDISRLDTGVIERRAEIFQVSRVLNRLRQLQDHAEADRTGRRREGRGSPA